MFRVRLGDQSAKEPESRMDTIKRSTLYLAWSMNSHSLWP